MSTLHQRPCSLQTKCAATNPIYEGGPGPVYESPGGEPLRTLLASTPSTPSTPLDSPRYMFDVLPPSLPPPRKSQSNLQATDSPSPVAYEECVNGAEWKLESTGEAYTVMRPAAVRLEKKSKPSPLVLSGLPTLPEV